MDETPAPPRSDGLPPLEVVPAASAEAPVVLLLPAMGTPATYYRPLLTGLAENGVCAVAVDLPQVTHRRRRRRAERGQGYAALAQDVLGRVRRHLGDAFPNAAGTVILGHSLGGHLALVHLALTEALPDGLVLVASGSTHWQAYRGPRGLLVLLQTQAIALVTSVVGHWPGHLVGFGGRQHRALIRDWSALARSGRLRPAGAPTDLESRLGALPIPVLAVDVAGDVLAPSSAMAALVGKLTSATVSRRHHAGSDTPPGHSRWARDPGDLAEAVAGWVRSVSAPHPDQSEPPTGGSAEGRP